MSPALNFSILKIQECGDILLKLDIIGEQRDVDLISMFFVYIKCI